MKNLKDYITEGQNFLVNKKLKNRQKEYEYFPENTVVLRNIIISLLKQGITDLNCIDVSKITDMSWVFSHVNESVLIKKIDISEWDVSHVTSMNSMFYRCKKINCDLSNWNVSNVKNMAYMFAGCKEFNSDLSNWNVSKVNSFYCMFDSCYKFNSDLSNWQVKIDAKTTGYMFAGCTTLEKNNKIPKWWK